MVGFVIVNYFNLFLMKDRLEFWMILKDNVRNFFLFRVLCNFYVGKKINICKIWLCLIILNLISFILWEVNN